MELLKQSSTAQPLVFLLVDSSDHITPKTGASPTVTLSKAGGSFASPAGAVTEIGSGWYKVAGNATDTNTLGPLVLHATASGADPTDARYAVVAFDPQDAVRGGLTALPNAAAEASGGLFTRGTGAGQINQAANGQIDANTVKIAGTAQTARDLGASVLLSPGTGTGQISLSSGAVTVGAIGSGVITAASISSDAITDAKVASDVTIASVTGAVGSVTGAVGSVTGNVGGNVVGSVASVTAGVTLAASAVQAIWDALSSALTTTGSIGKRMVDYLTGDAFARLGAPAGASHAADTAAVKSDTAAILWQTGTTGVVVSASAIRSAVGLASANLDTQLASHTSSLSTLVTAAAAILDDTGTSGVVVASGSKSGYSLAASGLAACTVDGELLSTVITAMAGTLYGVCEVSGSESTYMKHDGTTPAVVVTHEGVDGTRTASELQ